MVVPCTLIPGDGIGPEVCAATQRVLEASGAKIVWETHNAGAAVAEKRGTTLPEDVIEACKRNKVALKGPIGTPIGKGFKSVKAFSTLTSKEQWMSQLWERFEGMNVGSIHARLVEARQSLRWTRAQALGARAANHLVVINEIYNVEDNVDRIREFASGAYVKPIDDETVRRYAEGMEQAIDIVQSRLTV